MIQRAHILVCGGTGCTSGNSIQVFEEFDKQLKEHGLHEEVKLIMTGCFGLCALGPVVIVYPEGAFYCHVNVDDVLTVVEEHIIKGRLVQRLLYDELKTEVHDDVIHSLNHTDFYKHQHRIALKNCGIINPECIDEYIAQDGYMAYEKCVTSLSPQQVIDIIKASGLRGRGGGGFPTGLKWQFTKDAVGENKYVVCNADEGDPGAFMDRSIMEGDPHGLIEAMMIAGYAIGSKQGYVYVRAEYPMAIKRLSIAIAQAREYGILGNNILGTGHAFDIELRFGAGAFVCGEETALLTSIEGNRGEPRPRPPFPAVKGLFDSPTLLNNVETYLNIPPIILNGVEWFTSCGTQKSKGTKVFALGGKIVNTGLAEIDMGTTIRQVVYDIGGGIPNGKKFKAVQTGGPSGGCIPAEYLDTPIDYENLTALGSMMGSGGFIVMDEDNCMVDIAKFFLEFTVDESCGKCTPCRIGNKRLLEMLNKITSGKATEEDLDKMLELCQHIKDTSLCGLGQTAPNPVLSTYKYFKDEYIAHVRDKKCPSKVCKDLLSYKIVPGKCIGCTLCKRNCPAEAITGEVKEVHSIDTSKCVKCGVCISKCKKDAIIIE